MADEIEEDLRAELMRQGHHLQDERNTVNEATTMLLGRVIDLLRRETRILDDAEVDYFASVIQGKVTVDEWRAYLKENFGKKDGV